MFRRRCRPSRRVARRGAAAQPTAAPVAASAVWAVAAAGPDGCFSGAAKVNRAQPGEPENGRPYRPELSCRNAAPQVRSMPPAWSASRRLQADRRHHSGASPASLGRMDGSNGGAKCHNPAAPPTTLLPASQACLNFVHVPRQMPRANTLLRAENGRDESRHGPGEPMLEP